MAPPLVQATSPVDWSILQLSVGNVTIPVARLKVPLYLGTPPPDPASPRDLCWLDSGAPISIVPYHVHHQRLAVDTRNQNQLGWAGLRPRPRRRVVYD
jgi:hypothetical protein